MSSNHDTTQFRTLVNAYFRKHGRRFPWRETRDPWHILLSEVMLQQTQTDRVVPKYLAFLERFPDAATLAAAPLHDVLAAWQGLGYNRRAAALQQCAAVIVTRHGGVVPHDAEALRDLPGIGPYTAAAIRVFAFGEPDVVIETNIRAALIHHFFPGRDDVTDRELAPVAGAVLDWRDPRRWYNALMDYGAEIKKRHGNPARRSAHHARQPAFEGSDRQARGAAVRELLKTSCSLARLARLTGIETGRLARAVRKLEADGLVTRTGQTYHAGGRERMP